MTLIFDSGLIFYGKIGCKLLLGVKVSKLKILKM